MYLIISDVLMFILKLAVGVYECGFYILNSLNLIKIKINIFSILL